MGVESERRSQRRKAELHVVNGGRWLSVGGTADPTRGAMYYVLRVHVYIVLRRTQVKTYRERRVRGSSGGENDDIVSMIGGGGWWIFEEGRFHR